jgi:hypothetical protein
MAKAGANGNQFLRRYEALPLALRMLALSLPGPSLWIAEARFEGKGGLAPPDRWGARKVVKDYVGPDSPGTILMGPSRVCRPGIEAFNAKAQEDQRRWQAQAEDIWRRDPRLRQNKSAAAKRINPDRWQYIRKRIHKPAK